ncbi:MAG: hypothetical protein V3V56_04155 [bacterium]
MAWIKTVEEPEAEGDVKEHYESYTARVGFVPGIHKIYSIKPALLKAYLAFSRSVTFGATGLGRRREEMLAVTISALLKCKY